MLANKEFSIEQIEGKKLPPIPEDTSYLIKVCHNLKKKKLGDFSVEDFRILLSQNISLEIIIPNVIEILKINFFAEGDFYEGDLLRSLLMSEKRYWKQHPEEKKEIEELFKKNIQSFDSSEEIKRTIFSSFEFFEKGES